MANTIIERLKAALATETGLSDIKETLVNVPEGSLFSRISGLETPCLILNDAGEDPGKPIASVRSTAASSGRVYDVASRVAVIVVNKIQDGEDVLAGNADQKGLLEITTLIWDAIQDLDTLTGNYRRKVISSWEPISIADEANANRPYARGRRMVIEYRQTREI